MAVCVIVAQCSYAMMRNDLYLLIHDAYHKINIVAFRWYLFKCMCIDLLHKPALINFYNTNSLNNYKVILFLLDPTSCLELNKDRPTWYNLLYYFTFYCLTCFEC